MDFSLSYGIELAKGIQSILDQFQDRSIAHWEKEDQTPVSEADIAIENFLRDRLHRDFPHAGCIGEESGGESMPQSFVIDPIDGTKSFIRHVPLFGTLIAFVENGQPLAGMIYLPALRKLLYGNQQNAYLVDGWKDPVQIKVNQKKDLSQSLLLTTDLHDIERMGFGEGFWRLFRRVGLFRTWGDCFGYTLIAQGQADVMIDPIVSDWDKLAIIPIIEGAGGKISSIDGKEDAIKANNLLACNPYLWEKVIEFFAYETRMEP